MVSLKIIINIYFLQFYLIIKCLWSHKFGKKEQPPLFVIILISSATNLDRIICLLCAYICHYIFPFYCLDIYYFFNSVWQKKKRKIMNVQIMKRKYTMTNINTQDRLFGLLQINPLSVFRSHQVLVLNAYDKY